MNTQLPKGAVLLVSESVIPGFSALYADAVMCGLTKAGVPHPLITSTRPGYNLLSNDEAANVQVVSGLFWSFWRPFIFRKLVTWVREREPILIHGLSAFTVPVCARLSQALEVPYVVTVQHFQKRGGLHLENYCHGVIAVSESLRENLVNDAHIPKELVHYIPAGIVIPKEIPAQPVQAEPTVPLISSFGRLIKRKDFVTLLKAIRLVIDKFGANCSFVIAGDGPEETVLRKMARDLKIDKQVTFGHGGAGYKEILRDSDVYVQCSKSEGFGTMVLQAMAHGVPVVATSTGGFISLVRNEETGYLVPVGDVEALANRLLKLLNDKELSLRMGKTARAAAVAEYNVERTMASTVELYAECVAQGIKS